MIIFSQSCSCHRLQWDYCSCTRFNLPQAEVESRNISSGSHCPIALQPVDTVAGSNIGSTREIVLQALSHTVLDLEGFYKIYSRSTEVIEPVHKIHPIIFTWKYTLMFAQFHHLKRQSLKDGGYKSV